MSDNIIEHKGRVDEIKGDRIRVRFMAMSACASCHASGVCTASDMENKEVEVVDDPGKFSKGEEVNVILQQSLGFRALFYGYVLPFIIVLLALFVISAFTNNEVIVGVGSLGVLVPYYLFLYNIKDRFSKKFSFKLQKLT